jgi:hypothetical protein
MTAAKKAAKKRPPSSAEEAARAFGIDLSQVRPKAVGRGLEITTAAAGKILDMLPSSVRRRARPPYNDMEGTMVGSDLWLDLRSVLRYAETRREAGRPIDTISGESHNKRGERETEYQREYKREYRKKGPKSKRGGKKSVKAGKGTRGRAPTRRASAKGRAAKGSPKK